MKINLLYLSLHNLLKRRYGEDAVITRKELFCELGKHFLVPKKVKPLIIHEMEKLKLLERDSNSLIKILKCEYDIERDANKFFKEFGIY